MATFQLRDSSDAAFVLTTDDEGAITDVSGPWPEEPAFELELTGEIPRFSLPRDVPDRIVKEAMAKGLEICYYDPVHCRTCYCDGSGKVIRCASHC